MSYLKKEEKLVLGLSTSDLIELKSFYAKWYEIVNSDEFRCIRKRVELEGLLKKKQELELKITRLEQELHGDLHR